MPDKPSGFGQFWQELKRRKVVRVITVYAAAAFVILELVSIIVDPLKLPEWTLPFMIVLLCVGFIIAVILSWVYDIHPGGIVKTKPAKEVTEVIPEKQSGINAWKIATYISVVVIIGLIIFNIFGRRGKGKDLAILDKSIAVLPFKSLSDDPEKQYLADGAMDAILLHLSKIQDLRVMARTSVEQYRVTDKTATVICQELDVAYLLEGSFQKYGDQARLILQLIEPGKEGHIWAKEYDRNWTDIFSVQSEVAQAIARELQAVITPEEKQLIEKAPTTSLTAYDFYQRGREEHVQYWLDRTNREGLERAEGLYYKALEYDFTFAQAYTGLALVYENKYYWETFLTEDFLDSMLILADIALSYDNQLAEAYVIRGLYYGLNYKLEQAINEYDKAIKLNPNYWQTYWEKGGLYFYDDLIKSLENDHKAASLQRGSFLPSIYRRLGKTYAMAGFKEKSIYYIEEALKLDDDSAVFYSNLAEIKDCNGNFEKAIEFGTKSYLIDSTDGWITYLLGLDNCYLGQLEEYFKYFKKYDKLLKTHYRQHPWGTFRVGHAYWINGFKEEAEYYFNKGLEFHIEMIELGRHYGHDFHTFYILAAMYAFLGEKDKAYENLRLVNKRQRMPLWMIKDITNDPLFDSIRDEPEFQQIVQDIKVKYQEEHERVRKWLEENDML